MRITGLVKRFFRSRQLICVYDAREWMLRLPNRAEITEVTSRGPMIFLSVDLSDVPRQEKIMFDQIPPTGTPTQLPPGASSLKPGGGAQA